MIKYKSYGKYTIVISYKQQCRHCEEPFSDIN